MNSFDLLNIALSGRTADRVPSALWFHFGGEFLSPEDQADFYLKAVRPQGWDLLKVMFEYRPEFPEHLPLPTPEQLDQLLKHTDWEAPFRKHRDCLIHVRDKLRNNIPIIDTGFSPWYLLLRWLGRDQEPILLQHPQLTHSLLETLAALIRDHVEKLYGMEIYGYFHATVAATPAAMGTESTQRHYDLEILGAARRIRRFLHAHGSNLNLEAIADYPFDAINYSTEDASNPSLDIAKSKFLKCVMGGLDETTITQMSPMALRSHITHLLEHSGAAGLILAPGCAVSPSISSAQCAAIRDAARNPRL